MKEAILFKNALVIDPASSLEEVRDMRISGGMIQALDAKIDARESDTVFDATGLWVCPGFVDIHTHLRDLGQKDKEDIESGTRAAAAGGFTTVVAMANTVPPVDNCATFQQLLSRIDEKAHIEVLPVAAVTRGLEGQELTNMVELSEAGAIAFSDDGHCINNLAVLRRAMDYARLTGRCIISHAEDKELSAGGCLCESSHTTEYGLRGIPHASETAAIAREIEIVRITGAPYHFTHISCAASVELIRRAKQDGLPVTADVTPHHLTLSVSDIRPFDTNYKMKPPLRLDEDRQALIAGLQDGTIDAIATDHAPHLRTEKATTIDEAAVGVIGLETAFALCHEMLVKSKAIPRMQLISLLTTKPASLLNLPQPGIDTELPATITIIDPEFYWTYDVRSGASKSHNSPFSGRLMNGKPVITYFRGKQVYRDDLYISSRIQRAATV